LANGKSMSDVPGTAPFSGGKRGVEVTSILLTPTAITKDNVDVVIKAGWIDKATACKGVKAGTVKGC
ncbi:MAG: D-xylose ABC transporter substrate-binding protein, partial [Hyphomicrobiales bacterium]